MANESILSYGTGDTLESSGASLTAGSFAGVTNNYTSTAPTNGHGNYPLCNLSISCAYATAPTAGGLVHVYRRGHNIDGTNDAPVPDASYPYQYVGSFIVDNVTTTQYLELNGVPLISEQQFYIENDADQTMSSGWALKVTPYTYGT